MNKGNKYLILLLISSMIAINGCGGGKYSDAAKATNEYADIMEDFSTSIEKSKNAGDAAKAINNFTDRMVKLAPKMEKLQEKYPELQTMDKLPDELVKAQNRLEEVSKKFSNSMMKMMPYMNDPEVQKAQERMNQLMQNLQVDM